MSKIKTNTLEIYQDSVTGDEYKLNPDGTFKQISTSGASNEYEASLLAGERGVSTPTLSSLAMENPVFCTQLASSASAQNIGGAAGVPVYIKSILLVGSLTAAATLTLAGIGTTTSIPALANTIILSTAGAVSNGLPSELLPPGLSILFPAGCQITMSTAADGLKVLVFWKEYVS